MKKPSVVLSCALLLASANSLAQQAQKCTGPQLGTWKLESLVTEDLETHQKTQPYGVHPTGYLSYGPDCPMYASCKGQPQGTGCAGCDGRGEHRTLSRGAGLRRHLHD